MKKMGILVFVVILVSFVAAYAQENAPLTFQDFIEGKEAFEENCIECHSLEWPLKKIANREEWDLTLTKMANTGAVLGKEQRLQVLEYLVAKSTFQQKCSFNLLRRKTNRCHDPCLANSSLNPKHKNQAGKYYSRRYQKHAKPDEQPAKIRPLCACILPSTTHILKIQTDICRIQLRQYTPFDFFHCIVRRRIPNRC